MTKVVNGSLPFTPSVEYSKYVEHSNIKEYETDKKDSKYLSFIDYVNTEIVHYKREVYVMQCRHIRFTWRF